LLPNFRITELSAHAVFRTVCHALSKVRRLIEYVATDFADGSRWDRF
jgi:hypothetical protein